MVWLKIILKNLDALVISHITGHVQVLVFPTRVGFQELTRACKIFFQAPPLMAMASEGFRTVQVLARNFPE